MSHERYSLKVILTSELSHDFRLNSNRLSQLLLLSRVRKVSLILASSPWAPLAHVTTALLGDLTPRRSPII